MFNKVIFIGNLTKDPDLKYTPQGTAVCNFRIAVNSKVKSGGEMKDEALFISVVVFGKQAESAGQYLAKGRQVLVEGRLQERSWEKDGQKHSRMEVVANSVRFLSRKGDGAAADHGESTGDAHDAVGHPEETTDLEPF
jgi:single-strand DNA-binding protein